MIVELTLEGDLKDRLKYLSKVLKKPIAEIIETSAWNYILDAANFQTCATCGEVVFETQFLGIHGPIVAECSNGHKHEYQKPT